MISPHHTAGLCAGLFLSLAALATTESAPQINAPLAWSSGFTGQGQTIIIAGTGVDGAHPDLAGKIVEEACYSLNTIGSNSVCPNGQNFQLGPGSAVPCPQDNCWHETLVAGVVAAVAPDTSIIALQCFSEPKENPGHATIQEANLIACLNYGLFAASQHSVAAVIAAVGDTVPRQTPCAGFPGGGSSIQNTISQLWHQHGIPVIMPTGNTETGGQIGVVWPACTPGAIRVGSVDPQDNLAPTSNVADWAQLLAPGEDITTTYPGGGYITESGTSLAVPHVGAAFALMRSAAPIAPVATMLQALEMLGQQVETPVGTKPRIDVGLAAQVFSSEDLDNDGWGDAVDNCSLVPNGPLAPDLGGYTQRDTDHDGYGNLCDPDLDNDGQVGMADYRAFYIEMKPEGQDPNADFNGDGVVDILDRDILMEYLWGAPGPSGLNP